jgi:hypothetical protein
MEVLASLARGRHLGASWCPSYALSDRQGE